METQETPRGLRRRFESVCLCQEAPDSETLDLLETRELQKDFTHWFLCLKPLT